MSKTYRIKPLVWTGNDQNTAYEAGGWDASSPFGTCDVSLVEGGWQWCWNFSEYHDEPYQGGFETSSAAKLAAEQHWHDRIAAALEEVGNAD